MRKVDVHCHSDLYTDPELAAIFQDDALMVVSAATGFNSGNRLLHLSKVYTNLKVCLGIHPEYPSAIPEFEKVADQIRKNLSNIVGIGEVGLPWYCLDKIPAPERERFQEKALECFKKFVKLASSCDLPLVLHAIEDTTAQALDVLEKQGIRRALFHWFEGRITDLERILSNGYFISVSPDAIHNVRYGDFTDHIPLDALMLESDGPWEYNGKRGIPSMIEDTAAFLADRRKLDPITILQANYRNYLHLFKQHL